MLFLVFSFQKVLSQTVQTFTSPGAQTYVVPAGVTSITVETWGGGGRGTTLNTIDSRGNGGGGGAYSRSTIAVIPGNTYFFSVGNGSTTASPGGDSWFNSTNSATGAWILAKGGASASDNETAGATVPGFGGQASSGLGDIRFSGGDGQSRGGGFNGGGGSSAGTSANGNTPPNDNGRINGATAPTDGGNGGNGGPETGASSNGLPGSSPGGGGGGSRRVGGVNSIGGAGGNGQVRISYLPLYKSEFISANLGSPSWCQGETRNVTVTIRNAGSATWTDGPGGTRDINIGVKWNTNGTSWNDYRIRTNAGNLAPGETRTYTLPLTASNFVGGGYTTPLAVGTNNITFDVVNEGAFWFGNNNGGGGPGNLVFTSSAITISPPATVGAVTPNQIVCSGSTPLNMSIESATGTIQWQSATSAAFTSGVTNLGANSLTLTSAQIGPITSTRYFRASVTSGSCAPVFSAVITATVAPNSTATSSAPNQTVCVNAALNPITFTTTGATNIGTPVNLPTGLSASWVSNTLTISGTPSVAGTFNYSIPLTGGCGTNAATGTITVNPSSIITNMIAEVCSSSAFSVTPVNGTNGTVLAGTTYSWTLPNVSGGITGGVAGSGASITGTLVNPTNTTRTAIYTVTPILGSCSGNPFTVTITVNPRPTIPNEVLEICSGSAFTISPINGAPTASTIVPTGTTYTWTVSSNPNVTGQSTQGTPQVSVSQTLTNTTNTVQTVNYTVTPTSGAAGNCVGTPFTVAVTVNPRPVITAQTASICSGSEFMITPVNGSGTIVPSGTTYTWTVVDNPNVTGEVNQAGPQPTISQTLINTSNTVQTVTYTVTPTSGVAGSCTGTPFTVSVSIDPRPSVTNMLATVCSGDSFSVTPTNSTNGIVPSGTTYTWSAPSVTGGITGGATGSGTNVNGTLINTTNTPQTATYTVTPASGGCAGNSFTVTITLSPMPTINAMSAVVCSDSTFTATPTTANGIVPAGTSYAWSAPSVTGGITGGSAGNGTSISGSLNNPTNTTQTATYTVTPTSAGCVGNSFTLTVTLSPRPTITNLIATVCTGDSFTLTPTNGTNGLIPAGTTYAWSSPTVTGGITGGTAGSGTSFAGTLTNPSNTAQTATYTVTPTVGSCVGNPFIVTITLSPRPMITSMTATMCSGDTFTTSPINGTNGVVPAGTIYAWSAPSVTGGITGGTAGNGTSITGTLTNPTNASQTATYIVTPTSGGCVGSSFTVTVTLSPRPTITTITAAICSDGTFSTTPANGTNGIVPTGTTYVWSAPSVTGGITGGAAGSGTSITGTLSNPSNTAQTATYTVTPTSGTCSGNSFTIAVTLSPKPTITNMTAAICGGDTFTSSPANGPNGIVPAGTAYTWSAPTVTGGITGGVAGSGTSIIGTLTNPTNTIQTATYTVTPTSGTCAGNSFTVTVTLSPKPTITNVVNTLCSGDSFTVTPVNGTNGIVTAGTSYTWSAPSVTGGITGGVAGSGTNINGTLTNPTNTTQTATYTVTPSSGGCAGSSFTVTITLSPRPTITAMTAAVCSNGTFTATPANGSNGIVPAGTTYSWSIPSVTGGITGGAAGSGTSISGTLNNTTTSAQTATYTVTPTLGSCVGSPFTVTVTVNPLTVITTQPSTTDYGICFGDGFNAISVAATGTALTYQWFRNTTNSNSGGTLISGATNSSLAVPSTTEGVSYYYAIVTGTCGAVVSEVSGRYEVFPPVTQFTSNLINTAQTICPGDSFTEISAVATGANLTYQWYSNNSASNTGGTLISGETAGSFTPPNTAFGPTYYYVIASSDCGSVPSAVSGAFAITGSSSLAPDQIVCVNTPLNPVITHTTTGATGIGAPTGLPSGVTASWSNNIITISGTPTSLVGSPFNYSIPLIGACTSQFAIGTITVNPRAEIINMSTAVCSGSGFNLTPSDGTNGVVPAGTTYSWSIPAVTGGITGGTAGSSASSISGTLFNPSNTIQTATYTVTPQTGSCSGPTFTVTVTVNPNPVIPNQTTTTCSGAAFNISPVNGSGSIVPAGTTYTWTVTDNPNVTGEIAQGTAQSSISQTLSNTTNLPQTVTYMVTPISGSAGSCAGTPFSVMVTVNPNPAVTAMTSTVCSGSEFTVTPINGANGIVPAGTTYSWSIPTMNGGITGGVAGSNASTITGTLTNPTNSNQTATYTVTPTSGGCVGTAFTVVVSISPSPTVTNMTASVCSESGFTVTPVNGTNGIVPIGITYSWPAPSVTGGITGAAAGSAASSITGTLINPTNTSQTATYTVTPISGGCAGSPFSVVVTVSPKPTVTNMTSSVCSGSGFTITPINGTNGIVPASTSYSWSAPSITGGITGGAPGSGASTISGTLTNPTNITQTATYNVTPTTGGCTGTPFTVVVTVSPSPTITNITSSVCSSSGFSVTPANGPNGIVPAGTTYSWSIPTMNGGITGGTAGTGTSISGTLTNPTNNPQTASYTVTPISGGCTGPAFTVVVTVSPRPEITNMSSTVCSGAGFTVTPVNGTNGIVFAGTTYSWSAPSVTGGITGGAAGTGESSITGTLSNPTNTPQTATYTVTPTSVGCAGTPFTVIVTVSPRPAVTNITSSVCSGSGFTLTPVNGTNGVVPTGTTYSWSIPTMNGGITGGAAGSGASSITGTLTNPTNIPQTATYTVTPTSGSCIGTAFTVTVTVNPTPVIPTQTETICSGSAFTISPTNGLPIASTIVPANTRYTWTVVDNPNVTGESNQATSQINISQTLTNTTNISQSVTYAVTPISGAAGSCVSNPFTVIVTVSPRAGITTINSAVCSGSGFSITPANGTNGIVPAGTTYSWSAPSVTGGVTGGTSGSNSSSITGTLTNTTNINQTATFTVTPSTGGCVGASFTVVVTVNPRPTVNAVTSPPAICSGLSTSAIPFTGSSVAGTTYQWTNSNPTIGLHASGSGNIPSFTATNTSTSPITATITVTPVANGCSGTARTFTITVNPAPVITVVPDYCFEAGKVRLTASSNIPGTTWSWNTNPVQATSSILVDLAANYTVIGTFNGCSTSASVGVAQELVVNGDFTAGNTGFISDYMYLEDLPGVNNELIPDTGTRGYGVGTNGRNYHTNFWGLDHTNNSVGPRNMMIVNGKGGTLRIWEQTVNVEPNTEYYFSGWAMSLNAVGPFARLRFEVNGAQVGTTANLLVGVNNNSNNGWDRFYGTWNSGSVSGPITLRVVNLEPALPGNDFALDDLSFGTFSTLIQLTSQVGTDNQTVCLESPLEDITYIARSGAAGPSVSGLPTGITTSWNGVTLRFTGTPTVSGTFNYTITTPGFCIPSTATGTITVLSAVTAGIISADQTLCGGGDPVAFTSTVAGTGSGIISYLWEANTNLTTPSWTTITGQTGATYDVPSGLLLTTQYRRRTIATSGAVVCQSPPTEPVQVTVQAVPTAGAIAGAQTICSGGDPAAFASTEAGTGSGAITYRWERAVTPFTSWTSIGGASSATYDAPAGLTATTQYRRFTISTTNGVSCESGPTAPVQVIVQTDPTAGVIAASQSICEGEDPTAFTSTTSGTGDGTISYRWESAVSPFSSWSSINGASTSTYDAPAGLMVTTRYRRVTISTLNSVSCESAPTPAVEVTIRPNNTVTPVSPNQNLCINTTFPTTIIHTTTGATGIVPQSPTLSYNLPNGVTPAWNSGTLTISGTPTEMGVFNYNIPMAGGCGAVSATGTITVENPSYPITGITVTNPVIGDPTPYRSIFTVYSPGFTPGTYSLIYSTTGINEVANQTVSVTVNTAGELTFPSLPYTTEGTTTLTILSIQKDTDLCPYFPPNNTTPYGVNCSSEFLKADGDNIFYIPSGVFEITIQANGDGLGGSQESETLSVIPGSTLFIVFSGTDVFVTEAPPSVPLANRLAQATIKTTGPNGRILINYECSSIPPCSELTDVFQYTDSEGYTVIRFTGPCSWTAPDGLDEFEVLVIGGGGGGGFGNAAGGGGGGDVLYRNFTGITMNGLLGLQGASFPLFVGDSGFGATTDSPGGSGGNSSFSGPVFDYAGGNTFSPLSASGGGGGGSTSPNPINREGLSGGSGGGGAAYGVNESTGGVGTLGQRGGNGYGNTVGSAGAGGGGNTSEGQSGTSTGSDTMTGGSGGSGVLRNISGEDVYYGAGGGATSSGSIVNQSGAGGSPYSAPNGNQLYAGGSGNNNGVGQLASTYGSGGGAGRLGGASGFPGAIYIRFPNFRILPVDFVYFNTQLDQSNRTVNLTWATAKEWENSHFEIERSINNVKSWKVIGQVAGTGYSDSSVAYSFQDKNLPAAGGIIYYRLKQVDFKGAFAYSDTKSINVEGLIGKGAWIAYPNPSSKKSIVNLELLNSSLYNDEPIFIQISDVRGVSQSFTVTQIESVSNVVNNYLDQSVSGVYILQLIWGNNSQQIKLLRE